MTCGKGYTLSETLVLAPCFQTVEEDMPHTFPKAHRLIAVNAFTKNDVEVKTKAIARF